MSVEPDGSAPPPGPVPSMLGMGWFPDQPGGLNRYFRDLHTALGAGGAPPPAVVVGPVAHRAPALAVASDARRALPARLVAYAAAARGVAGRGDLIDAHFALYAALPLAGPLRRHRLVVHFHGPWADESREGGGQTLAVTAKRAIERAVYRRADRFVVLSGAFGRVLVERYGIRPWRIEVVPPGVDLERFTPGDGHERGRLGVDPACWTAVVARRLVPRMGLETLLRAWAEMSDDDGPRLLAVVGDGPLHGNLVALAQELGVAPTVRFLGRVSDTELRDWYRAADVCVVPSHALEGFGLVVLESLACGTPVVVTDVGGLPAAVAGLGHDTVVPARDHHALARRLADARSGDAPLPSPTACRAHAERFTWERSAAAHRRIYASVVRPARARRPRVVFLDHCAELSGGEIALARTLAGMSGVDAHVILAEEGPLASRLAREGVSVEVLRMPEGSRGLRRERVTPGRLPLAAAATTGLHVIRLARRLRRLRPDLVETNSLKSALYGGLAARIAGVPVVWHIRDRLAADYLPAAAVRLVHAAARRLPDAIIVNSRATRATLPPVRCPVEVIHSPVPGFARRNGRPRPDRGPLTVGMVGRLAPWKGQHLFLEAFARAFETGDERAVLVGAALFGEQDYERALRDQVTGLGLDDRIAFRGFRDDVPHELSRMDVLVHSSTIPEPLGLVVLEGLAAGLPVVVPDVGGPAEVVRDGENGLVYRAGDVGALARALRRLRDEPELRSELASRGRESVEAFAPEVIAAQTERLYARVLARTRVGSAR